MTFSDDLLNWYDKNARVLPWRVPPAARLSGSTPNPYRIWLSEVMLQQTVVKAVVPYFSKFLTLWPSVDLLAKAESNDVMAAWAGLGYYSRARNLKRCAEIVYRDFNGQFPLNRAGLLNLPGVGDYTASAIAAIAYNENVVVMDGNVERVSARLLALNVPLPAAKIEIRQFLEPIVPSNRPGDFAQAMMDLGATICTPRSPLCVICPIAAHCKSFGNDPARFPVKPAKKAKPSRKGAAFVVLNEFGEIWLQRRAERGLLAGMAGVPTTDWSVKHDGETGANAAPFAGNWVHKGSITHVFTHFNLELLVYLSRNSKTFGHGWWANDLAKEALPTVMNKVIQRAISNEDQSND